MCQYPFRRQRGVPLRESILEAVGLLSSTFRTEPTEGELQLGCGADKTTPRHSSGYWTLTAEFSRTACRVAHVEL